MYAPVLRFGPRLWRGRNDETPAPRRVGLPVRRRVLVYGIVKNDLSVFVFAPSSFWITPRGENTRELSVKTQNINNMCITGGECVGDSVIAPCLSD